jgi:hypothetical protein
MNYKLYNKNTLKKELLSEAKLQENKDKYLDEKLPFVDRMKYMTEVAYAEIQREINQFIDRVCHEDGIIPVMEIQYRNPSPDPNDLWKEEYRTSLIVTVNIRAACSCGERKMDIQKEYQLLYTDRCPLSDAEKWMLDNGYVNKNQISLPLSEEEK